MRIKMDEIKIRVKEGRKNQRIVYGKEKKIKIGGKSRWRI